jgi:hypothetical protein
MKQIEEKISKLNMDYYKIINILFSYPFLSVNSFAEKI